METFVVIGANRGIGLALCELLVSQGQHVIAVCRTPTKPLLELKLDVISGIDVSNDNAINNLRKQLQSYTSINTVIYCAGIWKKGNLDDINFSEVVELFNTNAVGALRTTKALLPYLTKNSKLVFLTSRMGSLADNTSGGRYSYRMSKVALNMAAKSLAHDLKEQAIAVAIIHPGWVKTDMTHQTGNLSASEAAQQILQRCNTLTLENTGRFWHADGCILPW